MDYKQIAIVGADVLSLSLALRLKTLKSPPEIVGYDDRSAAVGLARAAGAFDRVERRPERLCQDADLVIIAAPLPALCDTLAQFAPHLRPGCLLTTLSSLQTPAIQCAAQTLPAGTFFIGGHLILHPAVAGVDPQHEPTEADAGLLRGALYCLTPLPGATPAVLDAFSELIRALGMQPFFLDEAEHDGLQVGVEELPDLLAIALLQATVGTPGWQEMRKFAGTHFATATLTGEERCAAIFLNREMVMHRLNLLLSELIHLRELLTQADAAPFMAACTAALQGREHWLQERSQGLWGEPFSPGMDQAPTAGQQIKQIFLGERLLRRLDDAGRSRGR